MVKTWGPVALIAAAVAVTGLAQTAAGHSLLRRAGLFQPPTSYTELAFSHPESLPAQLASPRTPIDVGFGIHNASQSPRTYHWSIVLVRQGRTRIKAAGVAQVAPQGRVTVDRSVTAQCIGGGVRVEVRLAAPRESIAFLTACPPSSKGTP